VPGYRVEEMKRSSLVIAKGLDEEGKPVRIKTRDDLLAQALEHEIDHINGILYIDHLPSLEVLVKLEPGESVREPEREPTS
jgi:peptide deformylase